MSVLIDTSVWVDHFRRRNESLVTLMGQNEVLTHPMVVAELACGTPPEPRAQTLGDLMLLEPSQQATLDEVLRFIEQERLFGLGCGLVDLALLTSTLLTPGAQLWTLDKKLGALAGRFGIQFRIKAH